MFWTAVGPSQTARRITWLGKGRGTRRVFSHFCKQHGASRLALLAHRPDLTGLSHFSRRALQALRVGGHIVTLEPRRHKEAGRAVRKTVWQSNGNATVGSLAFVASSTQTTLLPMTSCHQYKCSGRATCRWSSSTFGRSGSNEPLALNWRLSS